MLRVFRLLEQLGVRSQSHKGDVLACDLVDQQQVALDVALAVVRPLALQLVVEPPLPKR